MRLEPFITGTPSQSKAFRVVRVGTFLFTSYKKPLIQKQIVALLSVPVCQELARLTGVLSKHCSKRAALQDKLHTSIGAGSVGGC